MENILGRKQSIKNEDWLAAVGRIEELVSRAELHKLFSDIERYFPGKHQRKVAKSYRNFYLSAMQIIDDKELKHFYESLMGGDPKLRNLRAIYHHVYSKYNIAAKEECNNG